MLPDRRNPTLCICKKAGHVPGILATDTTPIDAIKEHAEVIDPAFALPDGEKVEFLLVKAGKRIILKSGLSRGGNSTTTYGFSVCNRCQSLSCKY